MQINQRRRYAAACGLTALIVVEAGGGLAAAQKPEPKIPNVDVAEVVERTVRSEQTFVGTIRPVRTATIGSATDGRVSEFPIEVGQRVAAGQVLAQLLTVTIELQVKAAEAELRFREEALRELVNGARPEEIEQARARRDAAEARAQFADSRRNRAETLFAQGRVTTADERAEAVAVAREAAESFNELKAAYEMIVAGPRDEAIAQAQAQVAMQQAMVDQLHDRLRKHSVISRFDGYVAAEFTEVGAWMKQGDPVAEIVALDEIEVEAHVVEDQAVFVRTGDEVSVVVPSLADREFRGVVVAVVPQADVRARTFPVRIRVKNEIDSAGDPLLKSGAFARVRLPTGPETAATLLPKDAVVLSPERSPSVYRIVGEGADQRAVAVDVRLGAASGGLIQVEGGVSHGDRVVVRGNERLPTPRPGVEPPQVIVSNTLEPAAAGG